MVFQIKKYKELRIQFKFCGNITRDIKYIKTRSRMKSNHAKIILITKIKYILPYYLVQV